MDSIFFTSDFTNIDTAGVYQLHHEATSPSDMFHLCCIL